MYQKPDDIHNDWVREKLTEYWDTYDRVHENLLEAAQKSKNYTDAKRGAKEKQFKVGMDVMLHWPAIKVGENKKFTSQWMPGWKVKEVISDKNVIITHEDGKRQHLVHVDRLKPYLLPKYTSNGQALPKADEKRSNTKTEEEKVPEKWENNKKVPEKLENTKKVPKKVSNEKVMKQVIRYPGLKSDVLKFTSSYFDKDQRDNSRYNLRKINRVNYTNQVHE